MDRKKLAKEIKNISIFQASEIMQVYSVKYRNADYIGRPCTGEVALTLRNGSIHLYLTREGLCSKSLPLEAAKRLADYCGVVDPLHVSLLQASLTETSIRRLQNAFAREGFFIDIDIKGKIPFIY